MCGVFGITNHEEAARMAYFGLYSLQHRGQESAGIASYNGNNITSYVDMGLVPDVFSEDILSKELKGHYAIGHVRYSTTGISSRRNAQPISVRICDIELALAHNGNLTNAMQLRKQLENDGAIFQTNSDSEIFLHLIAHNLTNRSIEEAILYSCTQVKGAYSLVILVGNKLVGIRDPHGFRPLTLGKIEDSYALASESCAFDLLDITLIRDIKPGEMVIIDEGHVTSVPLLHSKNVPTRQCIFELIYFARPDSIVFGEDVYHCRKNMGIELSNECKTHADLVMPFPDSGVYAALGFSQASGIPYEQAYIRNHYVGRTFIQPSQNIRDFGVRIKLNPVRSMIANKRLCIIDDSIVRGTTVSTRVKKLRELKASEIHFRVSCPPLRFPCFYGINFSSKGELIAAKHPIEDLPNLLHLDTLYYLSLEGLLKSVSTSNNYCLACLNGEYPVPYEQKSVCSGCPKTKDSTK
ncbi:amidophosphoribosyltransferase [Lawsonia intracellularis]|uniref:Amidophosphoribosyltransferase n=1 Tax=Lawsonia intracellularis (strain PHE/MN1-00) TaxID=363253 RepID=Q1MPT5_LAWIP|nr:amidophosphoribosyltransferase [Lawsonia intracellularis]AGC50365.1 amidophosphoribosyltransferase [Lawsonia intracellularis N343]KAA0204386.1 amidophosphoribosyltransferase [Lawsonia intracellularis]MBZ3892810.1 amidophosphoribosyltransferase [Lawsonia intracellularis]OMQ02834.1 amidophosphoribosyltransferase [Lawsonia intracellularis]RBN33029.1 amidophosphoribosyltransferase [Lawsonia intracellularis]